MKQSALDSLIRSRLLASASFHSLDSLAWAARAATNTDGQLENVSVKLYTSDWDLCHKVSRYFNSPGQPVSASGILRAGCRIYLDGALQLIEERQQAVLEAAAAVLLAGADKLNGETKRALRERLR